MKHKEVVIKLIEAYKKRDISNIDTFMELFTENVELIGIGATKPNAYEWHTGIKEVREIIISDFTHWGEVAFDKDTLRINDYGETASFRICATLKQVENSTEVWDFFKSQMLERLNDDNKTSDQLFNAMYYAMQRMYENHLGTGYKWPLVITGNIVTIEGKKQISLLHWSMPVS